MMRYVTMIGISLLLVVCVASCSSLPSDRYLVGGGIFVEFHTPVPGTLIWADYRTQRIIASMTMAEGSDRMQFTIGEFGGAEEFERSFGVTMSELDPVLYFIPAGESWRQ